MALQLQDYFVATNCLIHAKDDGILTNGAAIMVSVKNAALWNSSIAVALVLGWEAKFDALYMDPGLVR